jgi:hypothetical protein
MSIIEIIKPISLLKGSHSDTAQTGSGCFMNVIAYLNGEAQITDQSPCVCASIRPIAIRANDLATNEQRQRLIPYIHRAMGTAGADAATMEKRRIAVVKLARKCAEIAAAAAAAAAAYAADAADAADAAYAADAADAAAAAYAAYAADAAKTKIFEACIEFLEEACNPPDVYSEAVEARAKQLVQIAKSAVAA